MPQLNFLDVKPNIPIFYFFYKDSGHKILTEV